MKLRVLVRKNQLRTGPHHTDGTLLDSGKHMVETAVMLRVALDGFQRKSGYLPSARPACKNQASPCRIECPHNIAEGRLPMLGSHGSGVDAGD